MPPGFLCPCLGTKPRNVPMKTYHDIATDGGSNVVAQVTRQANRLKDRLSSVRHSVAIMSGKGGVGKSTVTVHLASALALGGHRVGILDADLNGSSITRMMGVRGQKLEYGPTGIRPPEGRLGIKVMAIDLFMPDDTRPVVWNAPTQKDAFAWRGLVEMGAIREFLSDTEWGPLDVLLIDLPPGTDKLPNLVDVLPHLSGAVIVTLPSGLSQHVVGRSVVMAKEILNTPILGLIENMTTFACPCCGEETPLFPGSEIEHMTQTHGLSLLGKIPFDPRQVSSADEGILFMEKFADTPSGKAIGQIANTVFEYLQHD